MLDSLLLDLLRQAPSNSLWCLGENTAAPSDSAFKGLAISNRYDVYQQLRAMGLNCELSDFDFSAVADNSIDHAIWRIAKEKAVNTHILYSLLHTLSQEGVLHLLGYRNEGMDSLVKLLQTQTDSRIERYKLKKQLQHIVVHKPSRSELSSDYAQLQKLQLDGMDFYSKPGIFGWQKVDIGSQLLMGQLAEQALNPAHKLLDLGCGYGYLSIKAKQLGYQSIDASDNNAASISACQANFDLHQIQGEVFIDDCVSRANNSYDIVLCNPPFHQGFEHDKALIERFCQAASRALRSNGQAFFVINQFVGLEKIAGLYFRQQQILLQEHGFKVLHLIKN